MTSAGVEKSTHGWVLLGRPLGKGQENILPAVRQPGQRCLEIFFSKAWWSVFFVATEGLLAYKQDARFVLGFWLSPSGQPTLSVWRAADGVRAETLGKLMGAAS